MHGYFLGWFIWMDVGLLSVFLFVHMLIDEFGSTVCFEVVDSNKILYAFKIEKIKLIDICIKMIDMV